MLDILLILFLGFAPMLVYAAVLWWFDRYEKEPLPLLIAAFLWGGIPSIILALIFQILLDVPIVAISPNAITYDLLGGSLIAPLTEEGFKGLALLILLFLFRREIDSPMDGLIYGGLVGFGFAAVENVFYFISAYSAGSIADVVALSVLRAGVFGLNHAMYTGFTGLGVALALEMKNKWLRPLPILGGLVLGMTAHALHNGFATLTGYTENLFMLLIAVLLDWGGVLLLLAVAIWSFFVERKRIAAYAQALVNVHAIPQNEVDVLKSVFLRNLARLKTLFSGNVRKWWNMGRYYQKVTEAAFAWQRMNHGDAKARQRLTRLEQDYLRLRQTLVTGNNIAVQ